MVHFSKRYAVLFNVYTKNVMNIINLPCRIIEVLDSPDNRGSTVSTDGRLYNYLDVSVKSKLQSEEVSFKRG